MVFWTWAKGLEDHFDGANRQNLRNFIHTSDKHDAQKVVLNLGAAESIHAIDMDKDDGQDSASLYYISDAIVRSRSYGDGKPTIEERHELARIPTCAVFHKLTKGRGVPHTFVGFIRQWPALPRVVVSVILVFVHLTLIPGCRFSYLLEFCP